MNIANNVEVLISSFNEEMDFEYIISLILVKIVKLNRECFCEHFASVELVAC